MLTNTLFQFRVGVRTGDGYLRPPDNRQGLWPLLFSLQSFGFVEDRCDRGVVDRFVGAFGTLVADPAVAVGVFFSDVREGYWYSAGLIEATRRVAAGTAKPVMIATNYSKTFNHDLAASLAADGIPVLEGTRESLLTLKRGFAWRDRKRERSAPPEARLPDLCGHIRA